MVDQPEIGVVTLSTIELAVRLAEACSDKKRPIPDARFALAAMEKDVRNGYLRMAKASIDYFREVSTEALVSTTTKGH